MLQRNPETLTCPPTLPFEVKSDLLEDRLFDQKFEHPHHHQRLVEKLARTRRADLVGAYALATALAVMLPYSYDVALNRLDDTDATPTVKTIVEAPVDTQDLGGIMYFLNGFDTNNADVAAETLAPAFMQISPVKIKSMEYNNASINPSTLADVVIEDTDKENETEISFVLGSASGIAGLEMVVKIIKNTDIQVKNIYFYETPDGVDGLLPGTRKVLASLQDAVGFFAGAEDSSYARDFISTGTDMHRWTDPNKSIYDNVLSFFDTAQNAIKETREKKRPRVELLNNYGWIIANADLEKTLKEIGEMRGDEFMPTLEYLRSTKTPNVVDTLKSSKNICAYAKKALLSCLVFDVESKVQVHTSYNFDQEANIKTLSLAKEAINASNKQNYYTYKTNTSPNYRFGNLVAK